MKANKGFVRAIINPELKERFNKFCMSNGLEILETTNAVVENAFELFMELEIKTIRQQLKTVDTKAEQVLK